MKSTNEIINLALEFFADFGPKVADVIDGAIRVDLDHTILPKEGSLFQISCKLGDAIMGGPGYKGPSPTYLVQREDRAFLLIATPLAK